MQWAVEHLIVKCWRWWAGGPGAGGGVWKRCWDWKRCPQGGKRFSRSMWGGKLGARKAKESRPMWGGAVGKQGGEAKLFHTRCGVGLWGSKVGRQNFSTPDVGRQTGGHGGRTLIRPMWGEAVGRQTGGPGRQNVVRPVWGERLWGGKRGGQEGKRVAPDVGWGCGEARWGAREAKLFHTRCGEARWGPRRQNVDTPDVG